MKTNTKPSNEPRKRASEAPKPHRLRDDPVWQAHYNAILTGLYSGFENEKEEWNNASSDEEAFKRLSARCERLTMIAYQGANHAHSYCQFAEPFTDQEIAEFNQALNPDAQ